MKELENFQSFRGDTIEHYDPDMGDKDKQQFVDFFFIKSYAADKNEFCHSSHRRTREIGFTASRSKSQTFDPYRILRIVTDNIGQQVLHVLEEKAAEGVEVRILYDAFGSHGTKAKDFNRLIKMVDMSIHLLPHKGHYFVSD